MNELDGQYLELLKDIKERGVLKPNRTGINARSVFGRTLRIDMTNGFPLLTTKHTHFKSILHELLWFLRGEGNIGYLQDNGITIWDEWADKDGNLGPVYGVQWRGWKSLNWVTPKVYNRPEPKIEPLPQNQPDLTMNEHGIVGCRFVGNEKYGPYKVLNEHTQQRSDGGIRYVFDVQFEKTGTICRGVRKSRVLSGEGFKDARYPAVAGVACLGEPNSSDEDHRLLYNTWIDMIRRCYDSKTVSYPNYGGKGIFVDNRWLVYSNFQKDAKLLDNWFLKKEFPDKYSLDKDASVSNKYCKEHCIWSSQIEQSYNRKISRTFIATNPKGEERISLGIKDLCNRYGLSEGAVIGCLDDKYAKCKGWRFKEIKTDQVLRVRYYDQIHGLIAELKNNPESRRSVVSAWNPSEIADMALPPCHTHFEMTVMDGKLNCVFFMRSCDVFLGLPFNIASYAILTHMVAQVCGLEPGDLLWVGGDVHLYENHSEQVEEQLSREPFDLPTLVIDPSVRNIDGFQYHHFSLQNYKSHPTIKAQIAV